MWSAAAARASGCGGSGERRVRGAVPERPPGGRRWRSRWMAARCLGWRFCRLLRGCTTVLVQRAPRWVADTGRHGQFGREVPACSAHVMVLVGTSPRSPDRRPRTARSTARGASLAPGSARRAACARCCHCRKSRGGDGSRRPTINFAVRVAGAAEASPPPTTGGRCDDSSRGPRPGAAPSTLRGPPASMRPVRRRCGSRARRRARRPVPAPGRGPPRRPAARRRRAARRASTRAGGCR